jgi:hypothetical protein
VTREERMGEIKEENIRGKRLKVEERKKVDKRERGVSMKR